MKIKVKLYKQPNDYTCGPAVLKTLVDQFNIKTTKGKLFTFDYIKKLCECTKEGTEFKGFNKALKVLGMKKVRASLFDISCRKPSYLLPILALIKDLNLDSNDDHYTLIRGYDNGYIYLADPYYGNITIEIGRFEGILKHYNGRPWLWEIV